MKFNQAIRINDFVISENSRTFIIAEAGVNHGGDMNFAKRQIELAKKYGADAVKFQAFKTENVILKNVKKAPYQTKTTEAGESQFEMIKKLEISKEEIKLLKDYCQKLKINFLITPFDEDTLDELDDFHLAAYKISSTDVTNLPFLRKVAKKSKPIILSTGMTYLAEVKAALEEIYPYNKDVILLQCCANYPINDKEANLNVIHTFKHNFDILVGYSDHSVGVGAAPYAVAMGAKVIEKHFTLDKNLNGPDHKASLNPDELAKLINEIRRVEIFLGKGQKKPTLSERGTRMALQKCMVAKNDIKKGELFTQDNIIGKRTGGIGISPLFYNSLLGKRASRDYKKDEIIMENIV
ncbi:N-acetylneuraminate synthase [bacterium]|nr:MAG: N-acetylneuraminate synthase [bacterium]